MDLQGQPGTSQEMHDILNISVADPGSGAFLTPGSGIQDSEQVFFQILDLGPGSQTYNFESL
jgi:hypothetical protein